MLRMDQDPTSKYPPQKQMFLRKIPLPDALIDYIQKNYPDQHGYVLTSSQEKYLEPRTMQKHFRLIQQKCGLIQLNFIRYGTRLPHVV